MTSFRPANPRDPADLRALAAPTGVLGYPATEEAVARRPRTSDRRGRVRSSWPSTKASSPDGSRGARSRRSALTRSHGSPGSSLRRTGAGRAIGRGLIERCEGWARSRGLNRIAVRWREAREDAHRFYANVGYGIEKIQRLFGKRLP